MNGKSLTRREYNQLVRTTADMFRLLPMLVFILVPFAEFLLPVVLHFFPNMLPSTFKEDTAEQQKVENDKIKKTLKAKIEMAKFLQKTIQESAIESKKKEGQTVESFANFIDTIRNEGTKPSTKDIMKFAKLFEDEITLDNLSRQQLRACCIMLNITPIGSDALLRFILQMKLRSLLADDKMIQKDGVEALSISELQSASRARGMRALGVSEERLREQMQQWLQLHLEEKIPTSLLLLSRALYLPETLSTEEKIGATITQLPETAAAEVKIKTAEICGEAVDNKIKLDIIKHEEAIIAAEKEQKEREAKVMGRAMPKPVDHFDMAISQDVPGAVQVEQKEGRLKLLEQQQEREEAEAKAAEMAMIDGAANTMETSPDELIIDNAETIEASASEAEKAELDAEITTEDLDEMESVLEEIAKERKINIEQDALRGLKDEVSDYKEDLEDLKDVAVVCGEEENKYMESVAARRLAKKVDRMIERLDAVVDTLKEEKSDIREKMDVVEQRMSASEAGMDLKQDQATFDQYRSNIISINEMLEALKRLQKVPDDSKLRRMFEVLDQDKDGIIDISNALEVLELLSKEHLNLSTAQVEDVLNLLRHEAQMEEEERLKEKIEKERKEAEKLKQEQEQSQKDDQDQEKSQQQQGGGT
ncbi:mitochondrial letm1 and EF-hand domain-containing protein 1 [Plakobranchus ocellatus]|uniref:Mitochondrial proton/calcium exchanger protein n=1 Tax=Plakobranchus ocellatus TaxID=259542 RepID=A0AAV4BXJ5_9GAST|nr:mitochondrial letm1 and EF-hand domain-containing protein 1 [Plakobranchus ocellatus]